MGDVIKKYHFAYETFCGVKVNTERVKVIPVWYEIENRLENNGRDTLKADTSVI